MNDYYIYHLIDPRDNLPFYIGKGKNRRMYKHEECVRRGKFPNNNKYLFNIINNIIKSKLNIIYTKIYDNLEEIDSYIKEKEEIQKYGRRIDKTGILCNLTKGGDGAYRYKYTDEQRKRAKETHTTPDFLEKMSERMKKYYSNEENKKFVAEIRKKAYINGKIKTTAKEWIFLNPQKEVVKIFSLRKYCIENGMGSKSAPVHLRQVYLGKRNHYKGWTRYIPT